MAGTAPLHSPTPPEDEAETTNDNIRPEAILCSKKIKELMEEISTNMARAGKGPPLIEAIRLTMNESMRVVVKEIMRENMGIAVVESLRVAATEQTEKWGREAEEMRQEWIRRKEKEKEKEREEQEDEENEEDEEGQEDEDDQEDQEEQEDLEEQEDMKWYEAEISQEQITEIANTVVKQLDETNKVLSVELYTYGGFSRVWLVSFSKNRGTEVDGSVTDSGDSSTPVEKLVIRTPRKDTLSLHPYQVRNEVSFLEYISKHVPGVPVPKLYGYEDGSSNPDAVVYTAQEFIEGQPLSSVWFDLAEDEKSFLYKELANIIADLAEQRFDAIGGLTLDHEVGPQVERVQMTGGRDKFRSPECYDLGPHHSCEDYLLSCYDREIYYYTHAGEDIDMGLFQNTSLPKFIDELEVAREALETGVQDLVLDKIEQEPFIITHGDFHAENILVRDGHIVSVIDWELAGIYPLSEFLSSEDIIHVSGSQFAGLNLSEDHFLWNTKLREVIEATAREREWPEEHVRALMGERHYLFWKGRNEMYPADYADEDQEYEDEVDENEAGENEADENEENG